MKTDYINNKTIVLEKLTEVHEMFLQDKPSSEVFEKLLSILLDITESEYGFIGEILNDGTQDYLQTRAITNIAWNKETRAFYDEHIEKGLEFRNLKTLFGKVITEKKPLISNNPYTDPRRGGLPKDHPHMGSFLGLPIMVNGDMIGMCGLANRPQGYDQKIIDFINPVLKGSGTLLVGQRIVDKKNQITLELSNTVKSLSDKIERLNEFTYIVSHDIRKHTSNLSMLYEMAENEKGLIQKSSLKMIKQTIQHLNNSVNFITKIVDINKEVEMEHINLYECIDEIVSSYRNTPSAINFDLKISKSIILNASIAYTTSIFENIISNAVKYQSDSNPCLMISSFEDEHSITIEFKDNGVGFDFEEHKDRVFNMYETFHDTKKGNGVGLYLVKKYLEKQKWDYRMSSQVNKGTVFTIIIAK